MLRAILLVLALVASSQAIWLYTADTYGLSYKLHAIDTTTYAVYDMGLMVDADGDKFVVASMRYDGVSGLIYATGKPRAGNSNKPNGVFAVDPQTAQVVWYNNCSAAPQQRFYGMAFDTSRQQYVLLADDGFAYYLSAADMRAGNMSAMQQRWSDSHSCGIGGFEYLPAIDAFVCLENLDVMYGARLFNATVEPGNPGVAAVASYSGFNWWTGRYLVGNIYYQASNNTLWALGTNYGPGRSYLFQIDVSSITYENVTASNPPTGWGIVATLPRGVRALTAGPAPTGTPNKWSTGYAGSSLMITTDNDLMEVNIDTVSVRNITRLSPDVTAIESFGDWDQIYAVVNNPGAPILMQLNVTTGEMTNVAPLPNAFQSLTIGKEGRMLGTYRAPGDPNIVVYELSLGGASNELAQFPCPTAECFKAIYAGNNMVYFSGDDPAWWIYPRNISDPSTSYPSFWPISGCPTSTSCNNMDADITTSGVGDMSFHAPSQLFLFHVNAFFGMSTLFSVNRTVSNQPWSVVDLHISSRDIAIFQYNRAWCSNRGDWNGENCVCDNAGIVGSRCETVLPAPVAPPRPSPVAPTPVATPTSVSAPMAAPTSVSAPVASPTSVSAPVAAPTAAAPAGQSAPLAVSAPVATPTSVPVAAPVAGPTRNLILTCNFALDSSQQSALKATLATTVTGSSTNAASIALSGACVGTKRSNMALGMQALFFGTAVQGFDAFFVGDIAAKEAQLLSAINSTASLETVFTEVRFQASAPVATGAAPTAVSGAPVQSGSGAPQASILAPSNSSNLNGSETLGGGAIAGIVIAVVLGVAVIGVILYVLLARSGPGDRAGPATSARTVNSTNSATAPASKTDGSKAAAKKAKDDESSSPSSSSDEEHDEEESDEDESGSNEESNEEEEDDEGSEEGSEEESSSAEENSDEGSDESEEKSEEAAEEASSEEQSSEEGSEESSDEASSSEESS